jgi:uridine monophosphate synthetase
MESFFTFLEKRVADSSSLLCVGLDPHIADLSRPCADAARDFCLELVRQTAPYAAAFKPNAAFFEQFGAAGWTALQQVIDAVGEQSRRLGSLIPVILDAKRGDIASTAEAYARSAFTNLGAHAITLSPYLGRDSITPFLADRQKGAFLLCKTSNPGAADLQDLPVVGTNEPLYIAVARLARSWNTENNIGLVVGATQPEAMARIRQAAPEMWFLAPGVGVQGGDMEVALRAGLRRGGGGLLLAVARGISREANPARAASRLRDQIIDIQYHMTKSGLK